MGMFDGLGVNPDELTDDVLTAGTDDGKKEGEQEEPQEEEQQEQDQVEQLEQQQVEQQNEQQGEQQEQQQGAQEALLLQQLQQMQARIQELEQQLQQPQQQDEQQEGEEWTEEQWQQFDDQFLQEFSQAPGRAVFNLIADMLEQYVSPLYSHLQEQNAEQQKLGVIENELIAMIQATDAKGQPLYPDIEELADDLDAYLEEHPELLDVIADQGVRRSKGEIKDGDFGILDTLYRAVKAGAAEKLGQQAYQQGLQQGVQQVQNKKKAELQKAGAINPNPAPTPEEQVINEMMSFRRHGLFG